MQIVLFSTVDKSQMVLVGSLFSVKDAEKYFFSCSYCSTPPTCHSELSNSQWIHKCNCDATPTVLEASLATVAASWLTWETCQVIKFTSAHNIQTLANMFCLSVCLSVPSYS